MKSLVLVLSCFLAAQALPRLCAEAPRWLWSSAEKGSGIGALTQLDETGAAEFREPGKAIKLPPGDWLGCQRHDVPRPAVPTAAQIVLANNDRLPGQLLGGNNLTLRWRVELGSERPVEVSLPLTALAVLWLTPASGDPARPEWQEREKKQDTLRLRNGDLVPGTLESFAEDGSSLRFKPAGQAAARPYEIKTVAALAFDPSLARVRLPKGPYARIALANGARLSVRALTADATQAAGTLLTGAKVSWRVTDWIAADVVQGKAVYLPDLKPSRVVEEPFNRLAWPHRLNASVKGAALQLRGPNGIDTFDIGLGMHSRTELTYALQGKYRRFEAYVGLDAATGQRGAVDIRVLVDDRPVESAAWLGLTLKEGTKTVVVDLARARELKLIVDYGPGGDVQDDVNWANPRLIE